jgi:predicted Ser/Thr protein kinase
VAQAAQFPHDDFGDRYAIERELGHGATATVYLARDLKLDGRAVAIKVLSEHFALPVPRERFLREIQTTAKLNHPHIVTLLEAGTTRGLQQRPFYAMRYIDGETLRDTLARGPLGIDVALRIARQVASALGHAHRRGVIHRDIKPGNIMLEDGHTWVTDFGIARAMAATDGQTVTSTGVTIGTPAYMSPEQAMGRRDLDARSDIYSLGCVLYEMLAGRMPFDGQDVQVILNKHLAEPLPPISQFRVDVPDRVVQLLDIALAKKPEQRFATAAEFAQALSLGGAGPLTPTRTHPVRLRGRMQVPRWAGAAVAGAAVIVAILTVGRWALGARRLDPTAYFVLPFTRFEGVPASVDGGRLLQDALNDWTGIKVVGRFEAPPDSGAIGASRARKLALEQGAGYFIRGEIAPAGGSMRARAALYATSDGSLVREREVDLSTSLASSDSQFSVLADRLLFDDTVLTANGGAAGTRSLTARQEFARGLAAVQEWELANADSAFRSASLLDPGFAQAHLWVAQVRYWSNAPKATWQSSAERAATSRPRLSLRDAAVSDALVALGRDEIVKGCRAWERLSRAIPHDFISWYGLATCLSEDDVVLPSATSSSGWAFRSSYFRATKAYQRAFQLLPSIHRALSGSSFASVRNLLMTGGTQVRGGRALPPDTNTFAAFPSWQGDTLAFAPYLKRAFASSEVVPQGVSLAVQRERELFHDIATAWATAYPRSPEAVEALAISLELLGDLGALDTVRRARALANESSARIRLAGAEVWMRIKFSVPSNVAGLTAARKLADSLLRAEADSQTSQAAMLASLAALTGRASMAAALTRQPSVLSDWGVPRPLAETAGPLLAFAGVGGPIDSLEQYEQQVDAAITTAIPGPLQNRARMRWLGRPAALGFPHYQFKSFEKLVNTGNYLVDAEAASLRRDTAAVRRIFADLKNVRRLIPAADVTLDALYPEAWLLGSFGGDHAAAAWLDPTLGALRATQPEKFVDPANAAALVQAMALRAEIADRTGDSVTAKRWARAVIILWPDADQFLQPVVHKMERIAGLVGDDHGGNDD